MSATIEKLDDTAKRNLSLQEIQERLAGYTRIHSLEVLPQKLKEKAQWILWRPEYLPDKDKVNKIPINPKNYHNASSTNPATWTSYDEAIQALNSGYGLGFVLAAGDGLTGIDIDHCIIDGKITPEAQAIIKGLNSYTEFSPSGTGIRIFVEADLLPGGNRKGQLEVYTQGRFLTVTGNHLAGTPFNAESRQEALDALHSRFFTPQQAAEASAPATTLISLSDSKLIKIAKKSKNGADFTQLMAGDISSYDNDDSRADLALCNALAFWTGKNAAQMDSIFRSSGLYRSKWDEMHGAQTYGQMTIAKAIADTRNVFEPKELFLASPSAQEDFSDPVGQAYFDEQGTFIPAWLAEDILEEYHIKFAVSQLWVYRDGVYRSDGDHMLEKLAQDKLGHKTRTSRIKETLDYIKRSTYAELPAAQCDFINVKNGRLKWKTSELMPHDPSAFEIVQLPVTYDPGAKCPAFNRYLETTLDQDVIHLVEEIMGYCLIPDTKYEKAIMCTGPGRNGKSIFLFVIQELLGKENVANVSLQDLEENRFRAAELLGKLANVFADLDARALKGSSFFKMLVSGDTLTTEKKFKDPFSFANYARLIFSANKLPRSTDTTFAFYERWLIIPFEKTFDTRNPATDPDLRTKLAAPEELSGIFNRAVLGLQKLCFIGKFTEPASVKAAINEYKRQNDSVMAFCEDCVDLDPAKTLNKQDLYSSYKIWCENQGLRAVSQTKMKPSLLQVFPQIKDGRNGNLGPRCWFGIELNEEAPKVYDYNNARYDFLD